jgi:protein-disulfide isomerase
VNSNNIFRKILLSTVIFFCLLSTALAASFSPEQVKDIQGIVKNYLINNPEILVEASQTLQKQQAAKAQHAAMSAIEGNKQALFADKKTPTYGNPNANTLVVEFFDYQCGHCKAMSAILKKLLAENKDVKFIFKELPIFGANSRYAARASLAAAMQGKEAYWKFHEALLGAANPLNPEKILAIAKKAGLNVEKLKFDMRDNAQAINEQLRDNFKLARELKLLGTPAFIISNKDMTKFKFIPGATSLEMLNKNIDAVK